MTPGRSTLCQDGLQAPDDSQGGSKTLKVIMVAWGWGLPVPRPKTITLLFQY